MKAKVKENRSRGEPCRGYGGESTAGASPIHWSLAKGKRATKLYLRQGISRVLERGKVDEYLCREVKQQTVILLLLGGHGHIQQ